MPIYEFYCRDCNIIFNFFSKTVNTTTEPSCPKCGKPKLSRRFSVFSITGKARENTEDDPPIDEGKLERAMNAMAGDVDTMDGDDPRQAAGLMRKLTDMAGLKLSDGMEEAVSRLERGDDPELVEAELGDALEDDSPFNVGSGSSGAKEKRALAPEKDETLYDM